MYVKCNIEARSCNNCCCGKGIRNTYSKCVFVAVVIRDAKRVWRILLSSVVCPALQYFSTLSHNRHEFRKRTLFNIKYVFWFSIQILLETFLILIRNGRDMIKKMYIGLHTNCPSFLTAFNENRIFSIDFRKILESQISWKSVQWEPRCSIRKDGWTNMTTPIDAFRNSANAPKHTTYKLKTKNKPFRYVQNLRSFQRRIMKKFWIFFILITTIYMKQFWFTFHGRFGLYLDVLSGTKTSFITPLFP